MLAGAVPCRHSDDASTCAQCSPRPARRDEDGARGCAAILSDENRGRLLAARGLLTRGLADYEVVSAGVVEIITGLDLVISQGLGANSLHDAGAYAQCSGCHRYTVNPNALQRNDTPCDCGRTNFWTGSFKPPGPDGRFSVGLPATRETRGTPPSPLRSVS